MAKMTIGVIVGNRDFFPDRLVSEGRSDILKLFGDMGIEPVILDEDATKLGAVETWAHARRCADLFMANRERIDGVLVSLPNFGDEKGVPTRCSGGLNVPVLCRRTDDLTQLSEERRRETPSAAGVGVQQYEAIRIPFTLTRRMR